MKAADSETEIVIAYMQPSERKERAIGNSYRSRSETSG